MWDFVSHYQKYCSGWISPFKAAALTVFGVVRCRENRVAPVIFLQAPSGIPSARVMSLFCRQLSWEQKEDEWCSPPSLQAERFSRLSLRDRVLEHQTHALRLCSCVTRACGVGSRGSSSCRSAQKNALRWLCFRCRGFQISLASL